MVFLSFFFLSLSLSLSWAGLQCQEWVEKRACISRSVFSIYSVYFHFSFLWFGSICTYKELFSPWFLRWVSIYGGRPEFGQDLEGVVHRPSRWAAPLAPLPLVPEKMICSSPEQAMQFSPYFSRECLSRGQEWVTILVFSPVDNVKY